MSQVKAKTLIEKMGYLDSDKKTPEHDKIQTWVYENARTIIDELFVKGRFDYAILKNEWEYQVVTYNYQSKYIVGFVDIAVIIEKSDEKGDDYLRPRIFIEVKTKIPSLGELLRQIKVYKTYLNNKNQAFVVVSPDDSYANILKKQDVFFYKYIDPEKLF